jgi:hypothetical protein
MNLRGRLLTSTPVVRTNESFAIEIELQNQGDVPLLVQIENPLALSAKVRDHDGHELSPSFNRIDILTQPRFQTIVPAALFRFPTTANGIPPEATLDLVAVGWRLAPGRYELSVRYDSSQFTGEPVAGQDAHRWAGTLELPPLVLEVR